MAGDPIWSSLVWSPPCHSLPRKRRPVLSKHISHGLISRALTLLPPAGPSLPLAPSPQHVSFIFPSLAGGWIPVFALKSNHLPSCALCLSCHRISMRGTSQWTRACNMLMRAWTRVFRHLHCCWNCPDFLVFPSCDVDVMLASEILETLH